MGLVAGVVKELLVICLCIMSSGDELRGCGLGEDMVPVGERVKVEWVSGVGGYEPVYEGLV